MFHPVTSRQQLALAVALVLLVCSLYIDTFQWLINIWIHDKPYSHGFFVPLISLYLFWIQRVQLRYLPGKFSRVAGGLVIAMCCLFLLLGRIGAIMQLELLSLFFIFPGIILFLCGWRVLRAFWFPLFYLQFMIPWTDPFLEFIYPMFRRVAAALGAWLLSFNYPVFLDNTNIYLPGISLTVVEACSGINFFISVTAIGLLLAYLSQKTWLRVALVVGAGAVLTVLINGVRVAFAGIMGQKYGPEMLHGPGHIFRGWFVAQVGWVGIFLVNWFVARIPHRSGVPLYRKMDGRMVAGPELVPETTGKCSGNRCVILLMICLSGFGVYLHAFSLPQPQGPLLPLESVPGYVHPWKGRRQVWFDSQKYFPGATQELFRKYQNPGGQNVYLYIGYFSRQTVDSRLVSYRSRGLLKNRIEVNLPVAGQKSFKVSYSRPDSIGERRFHLLTWYVYADGPVAEPLRAKLEGLVNAFLYRRNNALVVLVATPVSERSGQDVTNLPEYLVRFASRISLAISALVEKNE